MDPSVAARLHNVYWSLGTVAFIVAGSLALGHAVRFAVRLRGAPIGMQRRAFWGYALAAPWILGFAIFVAGPSLASLYYSFTDYRLGDSLSWIGLENYRILIEGVGADGRRVVDPGRADRAADRTAVPLQPLGPLRGVRRMATRPAPARELPHRRPTWSARSARRRGTALLVYLTLIAGSAFFLFPVAWMAGTSLKTIEEVGQPQLRLLPETPQWSNYGELLRERSFHRVYGNSVFTTFVVLLGTVSSLVVVAFAFARPRWPGRDVVFGLMMGTLMLPVQATLVPQYVMFYELGWIRTFNPITLPGFFAGGAAMVFLLRQFMLTLPKELDEAATIDGANPLQTLWHVILPLSRPAVATVTVFLFVAQWNNLIQPLLYLQKAELFTLPIYVAQKNNLQESPLPWQEVMAASVLFVNPVLVVFLLTQRYFVEGITMTGSKG